MNKIISINLFLFLFLGSVSANETLKVFSKDDIKVIAGTYIENMPGFDNPVFADTDNDGDFDALIFNDGNVELYKNIGSLTGPLFVLEDKNYDSYTSAFFIEPKIPYPLFFADKDGDNDLDLFVVKDESYNNSLQRTEYKVAAAENFLGLDQGTLITIILVLIIVVLVLAIL